MKKKVLSLLLILAMILSILPASVFADGGKINVSISHPNAASAKLFAESDTAMATDLLDGADTVSVEAGRYILALYNETQACLGTIMLGVSSENNSFTVYAVSVTCENEGWVCGTDYTVKPHAMSGGGDATVVRDIALGKNGSSFLCLEGDNVSAKIVPSDTRKAEGFAPATGANVVTGEGHAQISATCGKAASLEITYPYEDSDSDQVNDYVLEVGQLTLSYIFSYIQPDETGRLENGMVKAEFTGLSQGSYYYRVSNPVKASSVSYGTYIDCSIGAKTAIVTSEDLCENDSDFNKNTVDRSFFSNASDVADLYLGIDGDYQGNKYDGAAGHLKLNANEDVTLYAYRNWLPINSVTANIMMFPDYHVQVVTLEGSSPITVTENLEDNLGKHSFNIHANGDGTALLLVTYDALSFGGAVGGAKHSAIWPENTGVIVVTVGKNTGVPSCMTINESLNTGIENKLVVDRIDAELDVLYYTGTQGASYSFKPDDGTEVTMSVCSYGADGKMTFGAFSDDGVSIAEDGTVTLSGLTEGKTIVRLIKDGIVCYQILRAVHTDVVVTNSDNEKIVDTANGVLVPSKPVVPGEKLSVQYSALYHPANKLSGIYNMSAMLNVTDDCGNTFTGQGNQYAFASVAAAHKVDVTVPASAEDFYSVAGTIKANGFGSYYGYHRLLKYEDGKTANFSALQQTGYFGQLPEISFSVAKPVDVNVIVKDSNDEDVASPGLSVSDAAGKAVTLAGSSFQAYPGKTYSYTLTVSEHPRVVDTFSIPADALGPYELVLTVPDFKTGAWDGKTKTAPSVLEGIYQIGTGAELAWFAAKVNDGSAVSSNAALTADIDLSNLAWAPIGNKSRNYAGTFDGNGHYISGLYIDDGTSQYQGLFGYVKNGTVKNLGVSGKVKGGQYTAGIVAYLDGTGKVEFCVNSANITGGKNTGGIAGFQNASAPIENCYNTGSVNGAGNQFVGGISGGGKNQTIKDTITNCYNIGTVYSTSSYGGAINGSSQVNNVTNTYYLEGSWTGTNPSNVNKAGSSKTSADLKALAETLGDAYMPDVDNINNGYPVLTWQHNHSEHLSHTDAKEATCIADGNKEYWRCSCGKYYADADGKTKISESSLILPIVNYHELKTLTFEGETWDALIDDPQNGGQLLYGSGTGFYNQEDAYQWTDTDTNLHSILSEVSDSYCFWNGGHAVSHYVSGDASTYGDFNSQLTVFKSGVDGLATSGGGNNGSNNFAVHYGYTDDSGYAMLTEKTLPSLSFADGKARVIDSMYVNNTCYALNAYTGGNDLTKKISEDDWVKIVAAGYNGTTKTGTAEFYLCNGPENIVTEWTKWDLSGLGKVTKVTFNITGSSVNTYGFSQPAYFAYDDVAVRLGGVTYTTTQAATYTETGMKEYWTCSTCGKKFSDESCTLEVSDEDLVISALKHTPVKIDDAKDATCTENGNLAYWYCDECEKYYSDAACTDEITKYSWIIAAEGHKLTKTAAKAATCTEAGNTEYWTCSECGKYFSDAAGNTEITENSWAVPAASHRLVKTAAKAAACTEAGNTEYWTCGVCGKYFSDGDGNTEIEKDDWIIKAQGHKDDNSDKKCDSCGADLSQPVVDNRITVYYTVLGDDHHGYDGSVHTLKNGGLKTWVSRIAVKVEKDATVWDVMVQAALDLSGKISYENSDGNYVSSITFDGEPLGAFDNGDLSGWMYTLNGTHPGYGVAQQKVSDSDDIVFHYTDDYSQEEGSEKWNEPYTDSEKKDDTKTEEKKETVETKPVEVKDGKADVSIDEKALDNKIDSLVNSAADKSSEQVVEIKAEVKGDANEISVGLPTASLSKLAEKTEATVDVQTPNGNVAMPSEALKEIVNQAGKENIEVKIQNKAPEDVKQSVAAKLAEVLKDAPAKADGTKFDETLLDKATVVDIKISAGNKNITGFNGNSITVSVPVDAKKYENGKYYRSFILSSDGSIEAKAAHITGGNAEVETSHLSTFAITEEEVSPFIDIDIVNDWFAESATKAFEKKIINGVGGNVFDSKSTFTRAMIVQVLYNLEGKPATEYEMTFNDVAENAWYADAVRWAQSTGIVGGYPDGRFDPNGAVTREQTALILMNYAKYKKLDVTKRNELNEYPDMSKISSWALDAVKWANALKLIIGSDNKLNPTGDATRAEAITILVRFIENVK